MMNAWNWAVNVVGICTNVVSWGRIATNYIPAIFGFACPSAAKCCCIVPNHRSEMSDRPSGIIGIKLLTCCKVVIHDFVVPPIRSIGIVFEQVSGFRTPRPGKVLTLVWAWSLLIGRVLHLTALRHRASILISLTSELVIPCQRVNSMIRSVGIVSNKLIIIEIVWACRICRPLKAIESAHRDLIVRTVENSSCGAATSCSTSTCGAAASCSVIICPASGFFFSRWLF